MHHQNLRSIASLLIGLLVILSRKNHHVHGFTTPIIRDTTITIAKPTIDANQNNRTPLPLCKALHFNSSPRILAPCTTCTSTTFTVVLQAEPTNFGDSDSSSNTDANDIVARRIIVVGDVDGGYYRSCVKNEVRLLLYFLWTGVLFPSLYISYSLRFDHAHLNHNVLLSVECNVASLIRLRDFVSSLGQ